MILLVRGGTGLKVTLSSNNSVTVADLKDVTYTDKPIKLNIRQYNYHCYNYEAI